MPAYGVVGTKHALTHGSIIYEYAKAEWHATSPVLDPNRFDPIRISYVFYRHRGLIAPKHGYSESSNEKEEERRSSSNATH